MADRRVPDGTGSRPMWFVAVAGVGLGVALLLSPMAVWGMAGLWFIIRLALSERTGNERRMIAGLLGAAILLRLVMIAWLFLSAYPFDHPIVSYPFDGDGAFMKVRALWMRNIWLGVPVEPHNFEVTFGRYGQTGYIPLIAYLQLLLGPAPFAIHLFNVCCYVGGAVLIHRTVRPSYGAVAALAALTAMLFMPTWLMWSASALKDSLNFLLMAIVVAGARRMFGRGWRRRVGALLATVAAAAALSSIRAGALFTVAAGLSMAVVITFLARRILLLTVALVVVAGVGSLGIVQRVESRVMPALVEAANIHLGNVRTPGHGYKLLDQRFYSGDRLESMTGPEAARFAVRSIVSFIVTPLPQDSVSRTELMLVPQQVLWYGLVVFAVPGVVAGLRRDAVLTSVLLGLTLSAAGVIALNSGNVGTLVRIRDSIMPFVACLSGLGLISVLTRLFQIGRGHAAMSAADTVGEA